MNNYPKGSEWRKWDLHVHTKGTLKNDQFKSKIFGEFCVCLFKKALEKEIAAIGITDYFNIKNYKKVKEFVSNVDSCTDFTFEEKERIKHIFIFPNVELRMMPVTDSSRLVNIHCLFNPDYECFLENDFFGNLNYSAGTREKYTMNHQGMIDLGKSLDSNLNNDMAYKKGINSFVVTHSDLQKLLDENKRFRENVIVAVSNSNKDGVSGFQKHYDLFENDAVGSLDAVRKSIYRISDCIFSSNENDISYFLGIKKDNKEAVKKKCGSIKPCIHGSDAHTEDKLFSPDQDKFCWIKADPTFEGLKQIIYEPESGERVKISPVMPDQKDSYKVIRKIRFSNTNDFPEEIEFNQNLCSIIGSRSSGKSALLAYIAHSVDAKLAEKMVKGPGEGENYHWDKIKEKCSIEWDNGKLNNESPGKIIYIRQNYLFEESTNSDEIKEKIQPVLFKKLPDFEVKYTQTVKNNYLYNQQISKQIDNYFDLYESMESFDEQLKNLGSKSVIEKEKGEIQLKIKKLKEKNQLSEEDITLYQKINADLSTYQNRIEEIKTELLQISNVSKEHNYFNALTITLSPALANLPKGLQDVVNETLKKKESKNLEEVNKQVIGYKKTIEKEKKKAEESTSNIKKENNELIEKYQKNIEFEGLVKKSNEYAEILKKINGLKIKRENTKDELKCCEDTIKLKINQRKSLIEKLAIDLENSDQSTLGSIKFKLENGFDDDNIEEVMQKINIRDKSVFIENRQLKIDLIRENPGKFLFALYKGEQKVTAGNDKKEVARNTLLLVEKILFTAEMEGDKIGGFSDPTMTPGKRALFLLKLILAESAETWPLLIDQPEDDFQ